ncbi:sorting nexin-5 isoform X1 [Stegostoma tigrinum]|uniref:sorting nexin-5 isoform X1 n=2 Tax=Stegostoma tigrinum TaxID=3053191 RepID=UPI00202AE799|nr:sorting nexin-5 isoform X1 [Stegostoma tigrinum]XP_059504392.1 sorting nexin-5 isoform X1 [Stegostoma tigrinum]
MSDSPVNLSEGNKLASVSMEAEPSILVDIPDALSEREKVKFTVHTKTTLPSFKKSEFSVIRQHEDFIWLHDTLVENDEYAGIIIPPAPAKPDFDVAREKMQKLGEGEGSMSKEEFNKMKQELEAEYLAVFKKTVSIHEVFLQRLAVHSVLGKDHNFHVFLEYDQDLSVRRKNTKEMFGGFLKSMMKSADEVLVSGARDADEFFEHEKTFLVEYGMKIKDSAVKAEKMTKVHKNVSDDYLNLSSSLNELAIDNKAPLNNYYIKLSELFEKLRKVEGRVSSDEDLKMTELLKYYMRDIQAAKDLLYRRARALVDYENANKTLDKARIKGKDVKQAELQHQLCGQKFEKLSESAKQELTAFRARRVGAFRKNLIEMTELELKHARTNVQMIQSCLAALMSN